MKASEFVTTFGSKGLAAWEVAAREMIRRGEFAQPPLVEVPVSIPGHEGKFFVSGDYLAIGEPGDLMRMPLTPASAQWTANYFGNALLPTAKMVDAIWRAAPIKLEPYPMVPNRYGNLQQFLEHSRIVDAQLAAAGGEGGVAGHKKDVIIARTVSGAAGPRPVQPNKVIIYGWHRPDGSHIQGKSDLHGADYLDYSHGIRLVAPNMTVDGRDVRVEDVLRDPVLSTLLTDEGPIPNPRFPVPASMDAPALAPGAKSSADVRYRLGFQIVSEWGDQLFRRRA